jgi:hypothetical protein
MGFLEEFALSPEGGAQGREQGGMDPHAGGEPQTYADFFNLYGELGVAAVYLSQFQRQVVESVQVTGSV